MTVEPGVYVLQATSEKSSITLLRAFFLKTRVTKFENFEKYVIKKILLKFVHTQLTISNPPEDCKCPIGYDHTVDIGCEDIDECSLGTNDCHAITEKCVNTEGSYECVCADGFKPARRFALTGEVFGAGCIDVDECLINTDQCGDFSTCENTYGSYDCVCLDGYVHTDSTNLTCEDDNECDDNPCPEFSICENIPGAYDCHCINGYLEIQDLCEDINECTTGLSNCDPNAACNNTAGSYDCICNEGFLENSVDESCDNIDECTEDTDNCDENATCQDTIGSFECSCNTGYSGDGESCEDIDECTVNNGGCHQDATCKNTVGSYECACNDGYTGNGTVCEDIDECITGNDCSVMPNGDINAICENSIGSYDCSCPEGYNGTGFSNDPCISMAVDECLEGTHDCVLNANCTDTFLAHLCDCLPGYAGNGFVECVNINECIENEPCHADASCTDTDGSFECACNDGYSGDGFTCTNIDECIVAPPCDSNGDCTDTIGSYNCTCHNGFSGDGESCEDIDECANTDSNDCVQFSSCNNTIGSYECYCNDGFAGDAVIECENINECLDDPCAPAASCDDNIGSFDCTCNSGYSGDGFICENIDECALEIDNCTVIEECEDTDGSYVCNCITGYDRPNATSSCLDINECLLPDFDSCDDVTENCINTEGSFLCECKNGFTLARAVLWGKVITGDCIDVNECGINHGCTVNSVCNNTFGSYECICNEGYEYLNGTQQCIDENECLENHDICGDHGDCVNTDGSFNCSCHEGFEFANETCLDINECLSDGACQLNADCINNDGSFECVCKDGYEEVTVRLNQWVRKTLCADINECDADTHVCDNNGDCNNTDGSYDCICEDGYAHTDASDPFSCFDIDECMFNPDPCLPHGSCNNTIGSYICVCDSGFENINNTCTNINECETGEHHCASSSGAICTDLIPGFECSCPDGNFGTGYTGDHCIPVQNCSSNEEFDICGNAECFASCNGNQCPMPNGTFDHSDCKGGCVCQPGYVRLESSLNSPCILEDECDLECAFYEEQTLCGNKECFDTCDTLLNGDPQVCPNEPECRFGCTCPTGNVRSDSQPGATCINADTCGVIPQLPVRVPFIWQMKELPVGVDVDDNSTWSVLVDNFIIAARSSKSFKVALPGTLMFGELIFSEGHNGAVYRGDYYASFKIVIEDELTAVRFPPELIVADLELFTPLTTILSPTITSNFENLVDTIQIVIPCHQEECYPDCGDDKVWDPCASQVCHLSCENHINQDEPNCQTSGQCEGACVCDNSLGQSFNLFQKFLILRKIENFGLFFGKLNKNLRSDSFQF